MDSVGDAPLLVIPQIKSDGEKQRTRVYSISDQGNIFIPIPSDRKLSFRWTNCINSSGDWLMVFDEMSNPHMLDPFSGQDIPLPPLVSFPGVEVLRDPTTGAITRYLLHMGSRPYGTLEKAGREHFAKAIVRWMAGDSDYLVAAIYRWHFKQRLAFASRGMESWGTAETAVPVADIVFFQELLLCLHSDWTVTGYDYEYSAGGGRLVLKANFVADPLKPSLPWEGYVEVLKGYLVRLTNRCGSGEKVLLFLRVGERMQSYQRTHRFLVYHLHRDVQQWVEVKDLEGHSIFLGHNDSISVAASSCGSPTVKQNCIYFTDDYSENSNCSPYVVRDVGIFSLENGRFFSYYPERKSRFTWPRLAWFMPSRLPQLRARNVITQGKEKKCGELGEGGKDDNEKLGRRSRRAELALG